MSFIVNAFLLLLAILWLIWVFKNFYLHKVTVPVLNMEVYVQAWFLHEIAIRRAIYELLQIQCYADDAESSAQPFKRNYTSEEFLVELRVLYEKKTGLPGALIRKVEFPVSGGEKIDCLGGSEFEYSLDIRVVRSFYIPT